MQRQERRDERTLQIVAALLVFVAVVVAGSLILVVTALTLGLRDGVISGLTLVVIAIAGWLAVARCARHAHRP